MLIEKRLFIKESFLELMGLKSREEGELGETFPLLSRLPELTYSGE